MEERFSIDPDWVAEYPLITKARSRKGIARLCSNRFCVKKIIFKGDLVYFDKKTQRFMHRNCYVEKRLKMLKKRLKKRKRK